MTVLQLVFYPYLLFDVILSIPFYVLKGASV